MELVDQLQDLVDLLQDPVDLLSSSSWTSTRTWSWTTLVAEALVGEDAGGVAVEHHLIHP